MSIDEAAKATRRYAVTRTDFAEWVVGTAEPYGTEFPRFQSFDEAQSTCDRLNLRAVLEAIREPSEEMIAATFHPGKRGPLYADVDWRKMIDHLIAQCGGDDA